ncbi:hypothetical protein [Catellatospora coxensis]|uniref:Uncharacterized protein n=1 Tax=Catellatospora coxensis TaxID=310354 RepID=A0A8J3KMS9_9ACTN|nr:hypothetical protein [Catellatospora coxensis]GIG05423.1 hypothetical protein Cco03nite_21230 [Catellatospora coxensis]
MQCAWFNSDGNRGDDCIYEENPGGMRNQASSLMNGTARGNR